MDSERELINQCNESANYYHHDLTIEKATLMYWGTAFVDLDWNLALLKTG
jgi:hypothetical protein